VGATPTAPGTTRGRLDGKLVRARPGALSLPADEVHVWHAHLDAPASALAALERVLAADERARAARFRFDRDRSRYIVGRGLLRVLLSGYTAREPERIAFAYGENGKPFLDDRALWFNISHSAAEALFAIGATAELGVDIEVFDERFAQERIAEHFFSPGEVRTLRSLPEAVQGRAFLSCWTRKEAFIKARGDGLTLALDSFDVTLAPGEPPALTRTAWSHDEPALWAVADLSDPWGHYIAALASRSRGSQVVSRDIAEIFENQTVSDQEDR
jgi:4'-phosphopantetheinyl transferase